jgi:ubiquinone/menaquinone biosynthesis C-methylase UbiE
MDLQVKEQIEIDYWKNSPTEKPESNALDNIVNKITDAPALLDCLRQYADVFSNSRTVLELGAGQGWASCIVKRCYPQARVIATDISEFALASMHKWEHIFEVKVDASRACRSYEIPEPDASVSCIFCFASAHHFVAHRRTLAEVFRVLEPGGHCFYLYEPSCRAYIHRIAKWRVNRKRPEVPEDVLIHERIKELAQATGLRCSLDFYPSILKRGPVETVYYFGLRWFPFLQNLLPCTINYHFSKKS